MTSGLTCGWWLESPMTRETAVRATWTPSERGATLIQWTAGSGHRTPWCGSCRGKGIRSWPILTYSIECGRR